ncbi:MAG: ATP-binding cassette domain-containing protein [Micromonosporaceae bacterium]|nr:ATP-binding cassette domain-containing protein [Micromonosporaceae bacterium]
MSAVGLVGVSKVFRDGAVAVDDVTLDIADGEVMVLLGPSGCGKSTLLRMIAGLEPVTSGEVWLYGEYANDLPPSERQISMVFQDYALYPHMTVRGNVSFPLKVRGLPGEEIEDRVGAIAHQLGIAELLDRPPRKLSGGQRQRVAMGRAIVREPSLFLMDEPLSNLDSGLRSELRAEISSMVRKMGVTTIYVTHDQVEALTMADRVAILRKGVLQDVGTPDQVYSQPATMYVAAFLGAPRMNLVRAYVHVMLESHVELHLGEQALAVPWLDPRARLLAHYHGDRIVVGVRAEALWPLNSEPDGAQLRGRVRFLEHLGHESVAYVDIGAEAVIDDAAEPGRHHEPRADLAVRLPAYPSLVMGQALAVGVALDQLHFFDPKGKRIDFRRR